MSANYPQISIITVVFNAESLIQRTIESVQNQSFQDFEHRIINGVSTDGTLGIIEKYKHPKLFLLSEQDTGIYDAMNKGIQLAKGKYLLFLNAGDELASDSVLAEIFAKGKNTDIYYGETNITDENWTVLGTRSELTSRKLPQALHKKSFLKGQVVSHQSFIVKKSISPSYNLKYRCSADIDWMLAIMDKAKTKVKLDFSISNYLQGGFSDSQLSVCWKERFKILTDHFGLITTLFVHIGFALRFIAIGRYKSNSKKESIS
ncbi:MAG: glycosyltransferase [Cyclobacteriaceae bacterium]|nr:glycosyltransferase [Cyclobacteriaceae bacterium HetDA_MAG_MS6]